MTLPASLCAAGFTDPNADHDALPSVPPGFEVSVFAREPLVRQPCSMAFDAKGRLCVGMGPQYRNPTPDTPGDSVVLVLDTDHDGKADSTKTFATGFNAIQGLAWHGRDLWVANAPDLTRVRDLDGDDEADEYIRVYTDLGNLEHGLHGLNWAPDGKLYMSKGNSKGLTQPGRIAPKPFRDLWGVSAPPESPEFPEPQRFKKSAYQHAYHDPADDWGREGGVLRCDDGGHNLEIVSRGFRNPWDITFDSGFNWLGTDNDQTTGDRVFMPFANAHFGWNHPWSAHWSTETHSPTAPVSGPLFEGSGTGVLFGDSPQFPPLYRGVFFINDWLRKTTFVWRPRWDGALLRPEGGDWEPFAQGGKALYRPTDLETGPDGALWVLGWSSGYGAEYKNGQMSSEGRVFRIASKTSPAARWQTPKRAQGLRQWTVPELIEEFDGPLPVWRTDAQNELVRRGPKLKDQLIAMLEAAGLTRARETWAAWTLGRLAPQDRTIEEWFSKQAVDSAVSLNLRIQALRILGHRIRLARGGRELPVPVVNGLRNAEPRLRFETVQAIGQARQHSAVTALLECLANEEDPAIFYAAWQTLRQLENTPSLKEHLTDARGGVRRGALLALLEEHALQPAEIEPLAKDGEPGVREIASLWLHKSAEGGEEVVVRGRPLESASPKPPPSAPGTTPLARNIRARSGARYGIVPSGLRPAAKPYMDRGYTLKRVPNELIGADLIQTANNDDDSRGNGWLSFETIMPVRLHVAMDTRTAPVPSWVREEFQRTGQQIRADHWTFQLYSREVAAGHVELGGNTEDGRAGGKGNYAVVLEPLPLKPPPIPTTMGHALPLLRTADAERGRWLFHHPVGAGCFNCHRLDHHGNTFGPDLNTLGERATPQHIVQSMLAPSAIVTQGFNLHSIETADADHSGILLEESGLSLTLGLATGQREVIPKSRIIARATAATSAMPAYDTLLSPQYVADLAAYLLTPEASPSEKPASPTPSAIGTPAATALLTREDGFNFARTEGRLVITRTGRPVTEFVFQDEKILRPYFANVYAPGGTKATRSHPPVTGVDATDHATMHPGIWLAFGDISGVDFWRNKGRIEHVRFSEPPLSQGDRLTFSTESRLRDLDGRTLCSLTNRFTLTERTNAWLLLWDATFRSDDSDFTFGDQEEMGFGARVATAVAEKNGGVITSSTRRRTARETWGQAAEWCDYSGSVQGEAVGITLWADPRNFRPSWWHNRAYGVFVANPFGRAAMRQGEKSIVTVKRGQDFRVRFGAVIHDGSTFDPLLIADQEP